LIPSSHPEAALARLERALPAISHLRGKARGGSPKIGNYSIKTIKGGL
jgi:hypothetical protein